MLFPTLILLSMIFNIPRKVGFSKLGVHFDYLRKKQEILWSNIESKDGRPHIQREIHAGYPYSSRETFLVLKDGTKFHWPLLSSEIFKKFETNFIEITSSVK